MRARPTIDWPRFLDDARRVRIDTSGLWEENWQRWSRNPITMKASGRAHLEGDLKPFETLLAPGETCHIGEDAALGLG